MIYVIILSLVILLVILIAYKYTVSHVQLEIDKIYIINLPHRTDRWNKMLARINKWPKELHSKIKCFKAYSGAKALKRNPALISNHKIPRLSELGCAYSHYRIWLDAHKKN